VCAKRAEGKKWRRFAFALMYIMRAARGRVWELCDKNEMEKCARAVYMCGAASHECVYEYAQRHSQIFLCRR
jgi:hypothetical protein